ncbi:MAG: hypothetical protein M1823_004165 [Watsoniomyces obsoletus]|nr:MAG: hypothetical protein M1823_004165 [Watsoniomyces obsoletus]
MAEVNTPSQPSHRGRSRPRYRFGRAHRNGFNSRAPAPPGADQATVNPGPNGNAHQAPAGPQQSSHRGGGQSQSFRGNRATGRRFGGHLTPAAPRESSPRPQAPSTLHADAPEFQPGQQLAVRSEPPSHPRHARRWSRSSAPDIGTRIHEDVAHGLYECSICTSELGMRAKIWSCRTCWTVFHLSCVKRWSKNAQSTAEHRRDDETQQSQSWRCPGCNLPQEVMPASYHCWCEKEVDPRPLPGLPPHSCGQTCGRPRPKCPHPCEMTCHAGPCQPCTRLGPTQLCFCGKDTATKRCTETNYNQGWSCGKVCDDLMPCGEHQCARPCHEGLCGVCEVEVAARCYCGKVEKVVRCHERGQQRTSQQTMGEDITSWTGSFGCQQICNRAFDCGFHLCQETCHAQDAQPGHCPRSPDKITNCPCGKTPLAKIQDEPRRSCQDEIPNCEEACGKSLACRHPCTDVCHAGECKPCMRTVSIACRCGRTESKSVCHQGSIEAPQCHRVCRATLSCGRHECGEKCCPGERKAVERQALKRKQRPLDAAASTMWDNAMEPEHFCMRLCGRKLKCGNHSCTQLCHKGPCGSCREAIFDELSCHCGRTVLQPPLPCGTQPPACKFNCDRPKSCGHPPVQHNCHGDEESCPKCPFLVAKGCMCGRKSVGNQQCWRSDVSCGEPCGRLLRCGSHRCQKSCHREGECEDVGRGCQQLCGKSKKACGHPCQERCHAPFVCPEGHACQHKILVTCACQHLKKELRCNASKTNAGNQKETLVCDDECARLERNRKLALALNIDPETHTDSHIPYSKETLELFRQNVKWAQEQERAFRVFAADELEKRLRFKPMPGHQRAFLHALAEDFGFDSESLDPEPHRHIVVLKTPRFVMAPMKTLAQCVDIRNAVSSGTKSVSAVETQAGSNGINSSVVDVPFNALILDQPRFALTSEELQPQLNPLLASNVKFSIDISFLPSEEVVLHPRLLESNDSKLYITDASIQSFLQTIHEPLRDIILSKGFAKGVSYCRVDKSMNVLRRQSTLASNNSSNTNKTNGNANIQESGGWSQVAAKAAASPRTFQPDKGMGEKSVFTVLGSKAREAQDVLKEKKKKVLVEKTVVVDDWEKEATAEDEEESNQNRNADGHNETIRGGGDV